jgi:preprotein translocase subunit SecE
MAKSRAQRKAEQRKKRQQELEARARQKQAEARDDESHAQHDTQVPHSADVDEVEAALEAGAADAAAPAPSRADVGRPPEGDGAVSEAAEDRISRRERRRAEKEQRRKARESAERRAPKEEKPERERGRVASFFVSVVRELQRVQWPDRDTLVQASAVTLLFVAVAAAYLGALDAIFSELVDLII